MVRRPRPRKRSNANVTLWTLSRFPCCRPMEERTQNARSSESQMLLAGDMPRRELQYPHQVESWLEDVASGLSREASLILIGSGALLWHACQAGKDCPLPEASMDVDPISNDEEVIEMCYDAIIGSEFEIEHGWHVNIMPKRALDHLPDDWEGRSSTKEYGLLRVVVPSVDDLLVPKLARGEPRDFAHAKWAVETGLTDGDQANRIQ